MAQLQGSTADALFVGDNALNVQVRVHPVVVFGILDHYNRRPEAGPGQPPGRVIGTLLGTVVGTSCCARVCGGCCFV